MVRNLMGKYAVVALPILVLLLSLMAARGLFRTGLPAGHDVAAYPVTQHQFHENIKAGVLFPRWAPDMRYGYGHPKLQYRPPLLHYLTEIFFLSGAGLFLSMNLAVVMLVFAAGFGMYLLCREYTSRWASALGAAAYLSSHYFLANLYLRAAWYEVAAYAMLPWVLRAQSRLFRRPRGLPLVSGALAWAGLACGHPQIMTLFVPVALAHGLYSWNEHRGKTGAVLALAAFACGMLIAAPYLYVAFRELEWVRMEIFLNGLEAYERHFISLKTLFTESWPDAYTQYSWTDHLGRPRHREMRGLNIWVPILLIGAPVLWFRRRRCLDRDLRHSMLLYVCVIASLAMALPVSKGIWQMTPLFHTFNFPWRVLGVTGFCVALLAAITVKMLLEGSRRPGFIHGAIVVIVVWMGLRTYTHSNGWTGPQWMNQARIDREFISRTAGIPTQFYTPNWVSQYARRPAEIPLRIISGDAQVRLTGRDAVTWHMTVDANMPAAIAAAHYYYPGWRIQGLPSDVTNIRPQERTGLIIFDVPAGRHQLVLRFGPTPDRTLAGVMSAIGFVLVLGGGCFLARFNSAGIICHSKNRPLEILGTGSSYDSVTQV